VISSRPVKIVTDSASDIPSELAKELDITVLPIVVMMGGKTYLDGDDLSGEEFYRKLQATRGVATTSLPSLDSFVQVYRRLTSEGCDILSIHIASRLSGTYNAALTAASFDGITPGAVQVIDSRTLSMAQGLIAIKAAEAARSGADLAQVMALAEDAVPKTKLYGALGTLEYAIRSGRVKRLPGTVGNLLSIKPIVSILPTGEATILERVRSSKKALARLVELTSQLGALERIVVMHGANEEGALRLVEMLRELGVPQPILVGHIGAALGTHLGPGAVGVFCLRRAQA